MTITAILTTCEARFTVYCQAMDDSWEPWVRNKTLPEAKASFHTSHTHYRIVNDETGKVYWEGEW